VYLVAKYDLAIIWFLCLLFLAVAAFTDMQTLRLFLGLPFALLFPGYVFWAAISPPDKAPDTYARWLLRVGLSVAVLAAGGWCLVQSPWGISFHTVFGYLFVFITAMSAVACYRRFRYFSRRHGEI
jgi:uncharacterized membrane protein